MKKTYEKPAILFESFVSSTNIALNCSPIIDNQSEGKCAYMIPVGTIYKHVFTDALDVCVTKDSEDGKADEIYNGLCYHVPVDKNSLFNS